VVSAVPGMEATQAVASTSGAPDADDEGTTNRTRTYAIILAVLLVLLVVAGYFLARNLGYIGGSASFNLESVTGEPVAQATSKLVADGLVVKRTNQVSTDAAGTVISTDPPPNSLVKKGDTVTLKVAAAAPVPQVTVPPNLVQNTLANAESILRNANLTWTISYEPNSAQKNTVLSTNPTSGTKVNENSAVALKVSGGPADVQVPNLVGQQASQAGNVLAAVNLVVGGISNQSSSQWPAGVIISSSPAGGQQVPPGTAVSIVVSNGAPPTTTTSTPSTTTTTTTSSSSTTSTT
jgi:hypothetical protein